MDDPTTASNLRTDPSESPDAWVERYGDMLYRVAISRVSDRTTAEDLVQEAFLAAWKNRENFDGRSARGTWLVAILQRKVADHFRRAGRSRETLSPDAEQPVGELFDQRGVWSQPIGKLSLELETNVERDEFRQMMHLCVAELPGNLATAFSLRELDAAPVDQACELLGITRKNLAVRLHRARLLLRRCLQARWLGEREKD